MFFLHSAEQNNTNKTKQYKAREDNTIQERD